MPPDNAVGKQALAAAWALNQMGSRDYYNLCERFIENAYGTSGRYGSAAQAGNALNWGTDPSQADVGDLVFFKPDPSNGNYGHVGIYVGNGEMVSATNGGITRDNFQTNPYWRNLFVGFGDPPEQWQGRPATNDLISGAASLVQKAKTAVGNLTGARKAAGDAYWGAAAPYASQIMQAAMDNDVPANVLAGLLIQESGGNPRAVSKAGAQGLMQFMPGTARGMGIDPFDPAQAIDAGAKYLKQLADQSGGDWEQAVGKYNAGPAGNLNNAETRNHMMKVMQYADQIGAGMGGGGDMPTAPQPNPYRGTDRGGVSGGPTVGDVQSGLSSLFDRIKSWGGNVNVGSGQRRASGGTPTYPGIPGLEGITSGGGGAPGGGGNRDGQVSLSIEDIRAALAKGGGAINDLLRGVITAATSTNAQVRGQAGAAAAASRLGGDPTAGVTAEGALTEPNTSWGPPSAGGGPAAGGGNRPRPQGWIDPNSVSSQIYKGIVGISNGLLEQIDADQARLDQLKQENKPDSVLERTQLQSRITAAQQRIVTLAPQLRQLEQEESAGREGQAVPGSTPYMKKIPVYKKVDGKWTIDYVNNPDAEEDPNLTATRLREEGANARQGAQDAAALARQKAQDEAALARTQLTEAGALQRTTLQESGANERANVAANTQRVTTALAQAVEQRRQDIDAQIRSGDLDLRTATEQFNQWYKQNVEAPIAILKAQQDTANYRLTQQRAVTERATAQAEHERGTAQIGQQMWNAASDAYTKMIPLTVGAGWGEGFQKNLSQPGPYQGNQGATYNVPESLDQFATRKVAEMLKGVSPYAASIASAGQGMGADGAAPSGTALQGLTDQAAGVAGNALANPFQMPQPQPFQLPPSVDIAGIAGSGMPNGNLTNQLDQFMPTYEYGQGNGSPPPNFTFDNVPWPQLGAS